MITLQSYLATTLVLPSPEFNDVDSINLMTKVKLSMSGGIRTTIKTTPNQGQKFNLTFMNLTSRKVDETIAFIKEAVGRDIIYTDVDSNIKTVRLLNPVTEFNTTGLGGGEDPDSRREASTLVLEFEEV